MATPPTPVKKVPADAKQPVIQPMLYKSVVTIYRVFALLTLYVVLAGVLASIGRGQALGGEFGHALDDNVYVGFRLTKRDAGFAARHHLQPHLLVDDAGRGGEHQVPTRVDGVLHGERDPEIGRFSDGLAEETGRRYRHDLKWYPMDRDAGSEDGGIAGEPAIPVTVADNGERCAAASLVGFDAKRAAQNRRDAQRSEVIAADQSDGGRLFSLNSSA